MIIWGWRGRWNCARRRLIRVQPWVPVGAGGSRLLRGNHAEHETLEKAAASYFGAESALYFGADLQQACGLVRDGAAAR